jgi:hypothetical protein
MNIKGQTNIGEQKLFLPHGGRRLEPRVKKAVELWKIPPDFWTAI